MPLVPNGPELPTFEEAALSDVTAEERRVRFRRQFVEYTRNLDETNPAHQPSDDETHTQQPFGYYVGRVPIDPLTGQPIIMADYSPETIEAQHEADDGQS